MVRRQVLPAVMLCHPQLGSPVCAQLLLELREGLCPDHGQADELGSKAKDIAPLWRSPSWLSLQRVSHPLLVCSWTQFQLSCSLTLEVSSLACTGSQLCR